MVALKGTLIMPPPILKLMLVVTGQPLTWGASVKTTSLKSLGKPALALDAGTTSIKKVRVLNSFFMGLEVGEVLKVFFALGLYKCLTKVTSFTPRDSAQAD